MRERSPRPLSSGRLPFQELHPHGNGPGASASLWSLGLHVAIAAGVATLISFSPPVRHRMLKVSVLRETKLVFPVHPAYSSAAQAKSSGGSHPASGGAKTGTPPQPTNTLLFAEVTPRTVRAPKLAVSPSIVDENAPRVPLDTQVGSTQTVPLPLLAYQGNGAAGTGIPGSAKPGQIRDDGGRPAGGVFSLSDVSEAPVLLFKVQPDYTDQARQAKYQGVVLLRVVIDENGAPQNVRVMRPLGLGLDEKAIAAVRRWRFRPGILDGHPVPVDANVEINFQLL
jgi:protein TonB